MLITDHLSQITSRNMARPAFRYLGKETNYAELRSAIARLSYLYTNELGKNARVALIARNSPAVIMSFFAFANCRALTIPLDPDALPDELIASLKETRATHIGVTSDLVAKVRELLQSAHVSIPIIEIERKQGGEYDTSFSPAPDFKPLDTDPILALKTSGNRGKSRFVTLNHKQIQHASVSLRGLYSLLPTDRAHTVMNWAHPFAWVHGMLLPLMNGATAVIDHGLEGAEQLKFLTEARVTRLIGIPSYFYKLLITCKNEKQGLPGTKSVTVSLGALAPEAEKVFEGLKIQVLHCYGQTENTWTLTVNQKPLPGVQYRVLDENGDAVESKDEREGQLAVSGPTVMVNYLDREVESKTVLRGTWLHTGDIVKMVDEEDGLKITFLGRKEEVALVSGEFQTLHPIGKLVKKISGVQDAAGFITARANGELVIAVAVVKVNGSPLNERQILDQCSSQLYAGLTPTVAVFTDAIPRDRGGNINTVRLRGHFSGVAG